MCLRDRGDPRWEKTVDAYAQELLAEMTFRGETVTSLDFKLRLRERARARRPLSQEVLSSDLVVQADCSRFLQRWFLNAGQKAGYRVIERTALGGVPYNEYSKVLTPFFIAPPTNRTPKLRYYVVMDSGEGKRDLIASRGRPTVTGATVRGPMTKLAAEVLTTHPHINTVADAELRARDIRTSDAYVRDLEETDRLTRKD
jgi:hypothetical protein